MTVSQLYALYRAGHRHARCIFEHESVRDFEVSVERPGLTALERVILELALHDATNGTPERTREAFDRAVEEGAELPERLGLRPDPGDALPHRRQRRGRNGDGYSHGAGTTYPRLHSHAVARPIATSAASEGRFVTSS